MSIKKIRVLIVDDSGVSRALIQSYLEKDAQIEVVGEAENGLEAVQKANALLPDVITMDLQMPVMDGMTAITEIMCSKAIPILVVSSVADAQNAYNALMCGALEVISKPSYASEDAINLVRKVKMLAGVSVFTRKPAKTLPAEIEPHPLPASTTEPKHHIKKIFAIASSTGGPQALAKIFSSLPANFAYPIVVAQHISEGFAQGLVDWLNQSSTLPIHLASEGEYLQPGTVYISPSEQNLQVSSRKQLTLKKATASDIYHPSCDGLLESCATAFGAQSIGIILTGMGKDGAKGIEKIYQAGGYTLSQDENTSIVFGMNSVAIKTGAVKEVMALDSIAKRMAELGKALSL